MSIDTPPAENGDSEVKVGVVGGADVVVPFQAAGFAVFPVEPGPEAAAKVEELAGSGLAVLFYTEDLHPYLAGVVARYGRAATPCLVMLPMGVVRHGLARLSELVKRSVGADVLGQGPAR